MAVPDGFVHPNGAAIGNVLRRRPLLISLIALFAVASSLFVATNSAPALVPQVTGAQVLTAQMAGAQVVSYAPPVDSPVIDVFRLPDGPYEAGNRGWEYETAPGTPVRAAAGGVVSFAGPVGGVIAITVQHDDGLRTSYTNLADQQVRAGDWVPQGLILGRTMARFHFGLRRGDEYLDPALILGDPLGQVPNEIRVRLVSRR